MRTGCPMHIVTVLPRQKDDKEQDIVAPCPADQ